MDFENDSSVKCCRCIAIILMAIKLLIEHFVPIPHVVLPAIEIFKTGNHISASYLHLVPTSPKTT